MSEISKQEFLELVQSGQTIFDDIDLENVDLSGTKLENLTFQNCFLSVDFRNCNLTNTKFLVGNIKTCDFRNANLTNVVMKNVSFEGTRFKGAITKGLSFIDNYCYSQEGIGQTDFEEWIKDTD